MATIVQTTRNITSNRKRSHNYRIVALSKFPLLLFVIVSAFLSSTTPSLFHPHNNSSMQRGMVAAKAATSVVSPKAKQSYTLLLKKKLSHDSFWLRYGLPEGRTFLGIDPLIPTCIKIDYQPTVEGHRALSKSYSPVSHPNQNGYFDLVVKEYPYEEGGGLGKYLCDMEVGSPIQAKLKGERMMHGSSAVVGRGWKNIGLVAGGTGIAPLLQIARIALIKRIRAPPGPPPLCEPHAQRHTWKGRDRGSDERTSRQFLRDVLLHERGRENHHN